MWNLSIMVIIGQFSLLTDKPVLFELISGTSMGGSLGQAFIASSKFILVMDTLYYYVCCMCII